MANSKSLVKIKREILLNVGILNKVHQLPAELSKLVSKEDCLEKPTQNLFCHLSHYLVSVFDPSRVTSLSWPIYDTTTQRIYRKEFALLVSEYSSKGLVSPVMASYLVNPGCYKVVLLTLQLCHLALEKVLTFRMTPTQMSSYQSVKENYKNKNSDDCTSQANETKLRTLNKYGHFKSKTCAYVKSANILKDRITNMENIIQKFDEEKYIFSIIDTYLKKNEIDSNDRNEILKIANVNEESEFFEHFLKSMDEEIDTLESEWNEKTLALYEMSEKTADVMKKLISRHRGEADKHTYIIEYNPELEKINTKELEKHVTTEQKYILKNIVKDGCLNFPNLLRGFVIGISYIMQGFDVTTDVATFSDTLRHEVFKYEESVSDIREALEQLDIAESLVHVTPLIVNTTTSPIDSLALPPHLQDFSDIKFDKLHPVFNISISPFNSSHHKFVLNKKTSSMLKLQTKSLATPHRKFPDRSFVLNPKSKYETHNSTAMSAFDRTCKNFTDNSAFTNQQVARLLSTKKTCKKRSNISLGSKRSLFNSSSIDNSLFRSQSSPNLGEEKHLFASSRGKRLSIMPEDTLSELNISNITIKSGCIMSHELRSPCVDKLDSRKNTQQIHKDREQFNGEDVLVNGKNIIEAVDRNLKVDIEPNVAEYEVNSNNVTPIDTCSDTNAKTDTPNVISDFKALRQSMTNDIPISKDLTPESSNQAISKPSSLEKLINRFKTIRATQFNDVADNFETIDEEKENFTAKKVLLPDLLSPNYNLKKLNGDSSGNFISKNRESLGTVLGVDVSILDQFDID